MSCCFVFTSCLMITSLNTSSIISNIIIPQGCIRRRVDCSAMLLRAGFCTKRAMQSLIGPPILRGRQIYGADFSSTPKSINFLSIKTSAVRSHMRIAEPICRVAIACVSTQMSAVIPAPTCLLIYTKLH